MPSNSVIDRGSRWLIAAFVSVHACHSTSPQQAPAPPAPPAPRPQAAQPEPPPRIPASLQEAIAQFRPGFADTRGEWCDGALMLAAWGMDRMSWEQLVAMPDSPRSEMMKDPEAWRGRLLCTSGTVVEIHADRSSGRVLFWGGLITGGFKVVRFLALGSTDGIVENRSARFCGIFVGVQEYPNVSGGVTPAAAVVGMFQPRSNRYYE